MSHSNPYDAFVMDHIKNARNYGELAGATHKADGLNPLCGDELKVYVKIEHDCITDIAFQCACCGISMASASVMTETVKTMQVAEARSLAGAFVAALRGNAGVA
ncbi:MAG: iron-sulfur cluster assembly scaffold protein, partial [Burkholderiales bacterium]